MTSFGYYYHVLIGSKRSILASGKLFYLSWHKKYNRYHWIEPISWSLNDNIDPRSQFTIPVFHIIEQVQNRVLFYLIKLVSIRISSRRLILQSGVCATFIIELLPCLTSGVANSKLNTGRIEKENVPTGRRLKWKRLCGPHCGAQSIEIC